jgi:hypothetical protein
MVERGCAFFLAELGVEIFKSLNVAVADFKF